MAMNQPVRSQEGNAEESACVAGATAATGVFLFRDPHVVLDGFESLRRHHDAKRSLREDQLTKIPIPKGGRVLDIGAGPGLYMRFWLEHTAESGAHFTLLDHNADALALAAKEAEAVGAGARLRGLRGDFFKLSETLQGLHESFDVIFIGNTIEYMADPIGWIRTQVLPYLKKGGVLAIRDLDCAFVNCNLAKPSLNNRIVGSRIQNCERGEVFHNPFLGRDLHRYLIEAGLAQVKQYPYFVEFRAPLPPEVVVYLSELHTKWYVEDGFGILQPAEIETWRRMFDRTRADSVLHNPNFYYAEAEYLVVGVKP